MHRADVHRSEGSPRLKGMIRNFELFRSRLPPYLPFQIPATNVSRPNKNTTTEALSIDSLLQYSAAVYKTLLKFFPDGRGAPLTAKGIIIAVRILYFTLDDFELFMHSTTRARFTSLKLTESIANKEFLFILKSCGVTLSYALTLLRQLCEDHIRKIGEESYLHLIKWTEFSRDFFDALMLILRDIERIKQFVEIIGELAPSKGL